MMDLYYIEEGYYDAGYYVYTANAQAAPTAISSVSCSAVKITEVQSSISSSFSVNAYGARTIDIDLFAFSDAAIAIQVDRIRGNNIAATSVFNIATSVERIQQGDADADAIFSAIINGLRSRDVNLTTQAAFSFDSTGDRIRFGVSAFIAESSVSCDATKIDPSIQGEGNFVSEFAVQAVCGKILQYQSNVSSTATFTATISHIEGADLFAFSQSELSATAERIRDNHFDIFSSSEVNSIVIRIRFVSTDCQSQSNVSCSVDKIKNAQADCTSQSTVSALVGNIKQYTSNQSSEFTVSTIGYKIMPLASSASSATTLVAFSSVARGSTIVVFNFALLNVLPFAISRANVNLASQTSLQATIAKTSGNEASLSSAVSVSVEANRFRDSQSSISIQSTLSITNERIRYIQSSLTSATTLTAVIGKQQSIDLYAFSNNSLTANAVVIRNAVANSQLQFTTNISVGKIPPIDAALASAVSLIAANTRVRFADTSLTANGGVVSLVDVIPGVQIVMGSAFITNKSYAEDGYVEDEYATNFLTIANYIVNNLQQLSAAFTLIANAQSAVQGAALLANSGTMTTTAVKITVTSSNQLSNANTNVNIAKTVNIALSVQSAFNLFANVGRQDEIFLTAFTNAALVATARKIVSAVSNNNVVSTLVADTADSLSIRGQANLSATFTSSAAIRKIAGFGAVLQVSGFTITDGTVSTNNIFILSSVFSVGATASVIRNGVANTTVVSSVSIQITRVRVAGAAIASAMAFAVEIRDLRLDEIVYVIPGENWAYTITSETRIHDIYGETRIRSITGESRIRTITGESRIHTT
jgi:hypothetical protein